MSKTDTNGTMNTDWEIGPDGTHGIKRVEGETALYDPISGVRRMTDLGANSPLVLSFQAFPTANGIINLVGHYEITDTDEVVTSAVPIVVGEPAYNARLYIEVTAVTGEPFTLRVTGTSVDQTDDSQTPADIEDITITGTGYYSTVKYWVDSPQISIVEASKSATITVAHAFVYSLGGRKLNVKGVVLTFTPDGSTWSINLRIARLSNLGVVTDIVNKTLTSTDSPARASNLEPGRYRSDFDDLVDGSAGEGLLIYVDQQKILDVFVAVEYE